MKTGIDGAACEKAWIDSGRDPRQLAEFLREYPAAFYLSWVGDALTQWRAHGESVKLKMLDSGGRGKRKEDSGLAKVFTDFLIHEAVNQKLQEGYTLTGGRHSRSAFFAVKDQSFDGKYFSESSIRRRYYDFLNRKTARFLDVGGRIVVGPTKITGHFPEIGDATIIGFWTWEPDHDKK